MFGTLCFSWSTTTGIISKKANSSSNISTASWLLDLPNAPAWGIQKVYLIQLRQPSLYLKHYKRVSYRVSWTLTSCVRIKLSWAFVVYKSGLQVITFWAVNLEKNGWTELFSHWTIYLFLIKRIPIPFFIKRSSNFTLHKYYTNTLHMVGWTFTMEGYVKFTI